MELSQEPPPSRQNQRSKNHPRSSKLVPPPLQDRTRIPPGNLPLRHRILRRHSQRLPHRARNPLRSRPPKHPNRRSEPRLLLFRENARGIQTRRRRLRRPLRFLHPTLQRLFAPSPRRHARGHPSLPRQFRQRETFLRRRI